MPWLMMVPHKMYSMSPQGIGHLDHIACAHGLEVFIVFFGHEAVPQRHFCIRERHGGLFFHPQTKGAVELRNGGKAFIQGHAPIWVNIF